MKNAPAFPCKETHHNSISSWDISYPGMTLLDYFAGQAMTAMIQYQGERLPYNHREIAEECYNLAYYMLKAKEKQNE